MRYCLPDYLYFTQYCVLGVLKGGLPGKWLSVRQQKKTSLPPVGTHTCTVSLQTLDLGYHELFFGIQTKYYYLQIISWALEKPQHPP